MTYRLFPRVNVHQPVLWTFSVRFSLASYQIVKRWILFFSWVGAFKITWIEILQSVDKDRFQIFQCCKKSKGGMKVIVAMRILPEKIRRPKLLGFTCQAFCNAVRTFRQSRLGFPILQIEFSDFILSASIFPIWKLLRQFYLTSMQDMQMWHLGFLQVAESQNALNLPWMTLWK